MSPSAHLCAWGMLATAVVLGGDGLAQGDPPAGVPTVSVPFAQYVPASARLFVSVRQLDQANDALQRAHAWRLLPLLSGRPADQDRPIDLIRAVTSLLKLNPSVTPDELVHSEMGVVARSWSELDTAVWFLRIPKKNMIEQWFPQEQRSINGTTRAARFFRVQDGLTVCTRDETVAVSRHWGPKSQLYETMQLMARGDGENLDRSPAFRRLLAHLPVDYLALAYLARGERRLADGAEPLPFWPTVEHGIIGLYEGEGRLNVAIQAALAVPRPTPKLGWPAVARLLRLPQTTLFASVFTFDFDQAYQRATTSPLKESWIRYLASLAVLAGAPDGSSPGWPGLGPHVIFAWGQDLRERRSALQLALMIECRDAQATLEFTRRIADTMTRLAQAVDPAKIDGVLTVKESRHLGVPIQYIPLQAYADKSELALAGLLADTEPAWTVWNGWLIFALSRDHIERIVEAQFGLTPVLATVPDVRTLQGRHTAHSLLAIVQAGLAADVLDQWVTSYKTGSSSLLDPSWWEHLSSSPSWEQPRLGIGMKAAQEPGVVVVARVYPDTAADGRFKPQDRILGVDGSLLSLSSPNADLRRLWNESTAEPGPRVRVLRGPSVLEVVLPKQKQRLTVTPLRFRPVDAAEELASLGRTVPFASLAVQPSGETHFSARLSLRFASGHGSEAKARN